MTKVNLAELPTDILFSIASFLPLSSLSSFSSSCSSFLLASTSLNTTSLLINDALQALSNSLFLPTFTHLNTFTNFQLHAQRTNLKIQRIDSFNGREEDEEMMEIGEREVPREVLRLVRGRGMMVEGSEGNNVVDEKIKEFKFEALRFVLNVVRRGCKGRDYGVVVHELMKAIFHSGKLKNVVAFPAVKLLLEQKQMSRGQLDVVENNEVNAVIISDSQVRIFFLMAAKAGNVQLLKTIVSADTVSFGRISMPFIKDAIYDSANDNDGPVLSYLLSIVTKNLQGNEMAENVNEIIKNALDVLAENGHIELTIQLITMYQLRVRFRQMQLAKLQSEFSTKVKKNMQTRKGKNVHVNTFEEENATREMLEREERNVSQSLKSFRETLLQILNTAVRSQQLALIKSVLESKFTNELNEKILNDFFKTALGMEETEVVKMLVETRRISVKTVQDMFFDGIRRKARHNIRLLLNTGVLSESVKIRGRDHAEERFCPEIAAIINEYL